MTGPAYTVSKKVSYTFFDGIYYVSVCMYMYIHVRMYICTYVRVCVCNTINMRIYNKINMRIYQLGKTWKYINSYSYKYKQMILALFGYADFMIGCSQKSKVDTLEKLQERAIRYVENDM